MGLQGFREIANNPFVYQESNSSLSSAVGIDNATSLFKIKAATAIGSSPSGNAQITIDPGSNGDITFRPNGSGRVLLKSLTTYGVLLTTNTGIISSSGAGTAGQLIISAGAGVVPTWTTTTYPSTVTKGDVLVASANNVVDVVSGAVTAGWVLTANGGGTAPTFQASAGGGVTSITGDAGGALTGAVNVFGDGGNVSTNGGTGNLVISMAASPTFTNVSQVVNLDAGPSPLHTFSINRTGAVVTIGDDIGTVEFRGVNSSGPIPRVGAKIVATVTGVTNYTSAKLRFYTTPTTSATPVERLTISETGDITMTAGNLLLPALGTTTSKYLKVNSKIFLHQGDYGATTTSVYIGGGTPTSTMQGPNQVALGDNVMLAARFAQGNTCIGASSGAAIVNATSNTALGYLSLSSVVSTADANLALGVAAAKNLLTGVNNTVVGVGDSSTWSAGSALVGAESSNVYLQSAGVAAESNVMRLGTSGSGTGQQNKCFIAGTYGVTPAGATQTVVIDANGQLGSAASSGGGMTWTVETADMTAVADHGYIANKAGVLTFTLPATCAIGKVFRFTGMNTAVGWRIAQSANQIIHFGTQTTTTGVAGYIEATNIHDSVELVCCVADLEFIVVSCTGNITVA